MYLWRNVEEKEERGGEEGERGEVERKKKEEKEERRGEAGERGEAEREKKEEK